MPPGPMHRLKSGGSRGPHWGREVDRATRSHVQRGVNFRRYGPVPAYGVEPCRQCALSGCSGCAWQSSRGLFARSARESAHHQWWRDNYRRRMVRVTLVPGNRTSVTPHSPYGGLRQPHPRNWRSPARRSHTLQEAFNGSRHNPIREHQPRNLFVVARVVRDKCQAVSDRCRGDPEVNRRGQASGVELPSP